MKQIVNCPLPADQIELSTMSKNDIINSVIIFKNYILQQKFLGFIFVDINCTIRGAYGYSETPMDAIKRVLEKDSKNKVYIFDNFLEAATFLNGTNDKI
jgi:hypothetical protein